VAWFAFALPPSPPCLRLAASAPRLRRSPVPPTPSGSAKSSLPTHITARARLSMAVFYPAVIDDSSAKPFVMPFFTSLTLYKDAEIAFRRREVAARHAVARARQHRSLLRLVRANPRRARLYRRRALSLARQQLRFNCSLFRQQALAAPGRCQPRHRLSSKRSGLEQIYRPRPHRGRRPQPGRLHRALGSAAPTSTATSTSPFSRAGRTRASPRCTAARPRASGPVDHEIFVNECDDEGKDEFPEACRDAAGVDRAAIHDAVGKATLKFFGTNLGSGDGK
jgi:hypothetical protein